MLTKMNIVLLIAMLFGANADMAPSVQKDSGNCSSDDCRLKAKEFLDSIGQFQLGPNKAEASSIKKFQATCGSIVACYSEIPNLRPSELVFVDYLQKYCNAAVYFTLEFHDCSGKIRETGDLQCLESWNPFPEFGKNGEKDESCNAIFGKDNCMKNEISELCGEEEWQNFKKNSAAFGLLHADCNMDQV